mmetsp:Transcript_18127/g.22189  ORF Transcript_18127/g.22189 Transcript_18127/m.22189 type:complete len:106 (-) Transcript_18127:101-418(-)
MRFKHNIIQYHDLELLPQSKHNILQFMGFRNEYCTLATSQGVLWWSSSNDSTSGSASTSTFNVSYGAWKVHAWWIGLTPSPDKVDIALGFSFTNKRTTSVLAIRR